MKGQTKVCPFEGTDCHVAHALLAMTGKSSKVQSIRGIPKGKAEEMLEYNDLSRFPLRPSEESEEHTEVPRRLFAYFLVGEKVGPRRERLF